MRIIIVSPSLNFLGGAQRVCLQTIQALRRTDSKIVMATLDKINWPAISKVFGEVSKPDEELFLFSKMPKIPILIFKQAYVALFFALYLSLIELKYRNDLIINMGGEIADIKGNIVYINAIPLRYTHLFREAQSKKGSQWNIYGRLYSLFLMLFGNTANKIITNSKFNQTIIETCIGRKALVINPPVMSKKIIAQTINQNRSNTVVSISRFRSAKGLTIIPQIAVLLKDTQFAIIGVTDNDSESCLKELSDEIEKLHVNDQVHIFENKPNNFTLKVLSNAKVFLSTQSSEAFGISVVESMAAGCVPVVPQSGGPWLEILDHQDGLYGFSFKNPREAAQKIAMLTSNEQLRNEISARARQRSLVFDASVFEDRFLKVVESVL